MFCLTVFIYGCKKENNNMGVLPPVTMEGKNTFGFMLDNTVWLPGKKGYFYPFYGKLLCIKYNKETGELNLQSRRDKFDNETDVSYISIDLTNIKNEQLYTLNSSNVINISMQIAGSTKGYYFNHNANNGFINIHKLDTINNIISGEFEIELIERESSTNKKKIYEGRFDLQMDYCTRN